jgi:putative ABC transport system substrate-binding protein
MVRKHIANEHNETMPPSMYECFQGAVWQRKKTSIDAYGRLRASEEDFARRFNIQNDSGLSQGSQTPVRGKLPGGSDPVQLGLVNSLARPGGNATGVSLIANPLAEKRIGLLRELLPNAAKLAMLVNPKFPNAEVQVHDARQASARVGMELVLVSAAMEDDFSVAFAKLMDQKCDTLLVAADPFFSSQRDRIVALAAQYRLPTIYFWRELAIAGGLMSYGASLSDAYRLGGMYVARILNRDKPADLPVVQPTKFELVLNLRTARSLGLTFPPTLLATADEVIE